MADPGDVPHPADGESEAALLPPVHHAGPPLDARAILQTMPLLEYWARHYQGSLLTHFHVIFILHFLRDLLGLAEAFNMAGLAWADATFLHKAYSYPHLNRIRQHLELHGARVLPLVEGAPLARVVDDVLARCEEQGKRLLIVEDGGYVVPLMHRELRTRVDLVQGAVEQTTKGIRADREVGPLVFPLLSVAECDIKLRIESPMVAKSVIDNIQRLLPDRSFVAKPAVVVGYGSIGQQLALQLRQAPLSMEVGVFDLDPERRAEAAVNGFRTADTLAGLLGNTNDMLIIGATGNTTIGRNELLAIGNNCVLVSASSDQREIGVGELEKLSRAKDVDMIDGEKIGDWYKLSANRNEILLLAEGYPINFWKSESLPNRISQVVLAPIFVCALALAQEANEIPRGQPQGEFVDRLLERLGITAEVARFM